MSCNFLKYNPKFCECLSIYCCLHCNLCLFNCQHVIKNHQNLQINATGINQSIINHFRHFNVYTISNNHHLNVHLTHCAPLHFVTERESASESRTTRENARERECLREREPMRALCCLCNLGLNQMATPTEVMPAPPVHEPRTLPIPRHVHFSIFITVSRNIYINRTGKSKKSQLSKLNE